MSWKCIQCKKHIYALKNFILESLFGLNLQREFIVLIMLKSLKWRFNISSFLYLEVFQSFIIMLFLSQLCPISFSISFNLMLSEKYTGKKQNKIHWHNIFFSFFFCLFIYLCCFTILYWFCNTLTWICHGCPCVPHPEPHSHLPPHPIPLGHPSAPALSTLVSCIVPGLAIHFTYDNLRVSMPFSHILPTSPSPTES